MLWCILQGSRASDMDDRLNPAKLLPKTVVIAESSADAVKLPKATMPAFDYFEDSDVRFTTRLAPWHTSRD